MHLHFLEVTPNSLAFLKYNILGAFALQKSDLAWDEKLLMRFYQKALDYDADSLFFNLAVQVIEMMFLPTIFWKISDVKWQLIGRENERNYLEMDFRLESEESVFVMRCTPTV